VTHCVFEDTDGKLIHEEEVGGALCPDVHVALQQPFDVREIVREMEDESMMKSMGIAAASFTPFNPPPILHFRFVRVRADGVAVYRICP
jgi:hypothetical protein